jgi:bifunctional non-homologous end joining protein LigD
LDGSYFKENPDWDPEDHAWSVLTGRTQEEIAAGLPPRRMAGVAGGRPMPEGAVEAPMPDSIVPMKASLSEKVPASGEWLFEIKWDGIRALCFVQDGAAHRFAQNSCNASTPASVLPGR